MSLYSDIRQLPEQTERVESGAVQFGDDWPGSFFRGDHAFAYAMALSDAIQHLEAPHALGSIQLFELRGLLSVLQASDLTRREAD